MVKNIAIIGLGKFGEAVLSSLLYQKVKNIFVVDKDQKVLNNCISNHGDMVTGVSFDSMQKIFLEENGINEMDVVIITISNIQSSVITSLNLIDLGIKKIIVKAVDKHHERILTSIGIKEVIQSDMIAAEAITKRATLSVNIPFQVIDDTYISIKIKITNPDIEGETIGSLKMFDTISYFITYIQRNKKVITANANTELTLNDELYIIVKNNQLNNLINKLTNDETSIINQSV